MLSSALLATLASRFRRRPRAPREPAAVLTLRAIVLIAGGLAFGALFACALPFAALAAIAARRLPPDGAFGVVALAWLADQALGFCVRHYPLDATTLLWGVVIGGAALAAVAAARRAPSPALAFAFAFVADQATMAAYGALTHDLAGFAPAVVAQIAVLNALCLVVLGPLASVPSLLAGARARSDA